ncbi:MAG TPA: acylphosphatase, partial [Caldithrix sp.]|nr:acylphosphatase [Caldithrix sp.]
MQKAAFVAFIKGMVQGVGYRYFAYRRAAVYDITGYVRNLADGSVEVFAEGPRTQLEAFLGELKRGPQLSYVEEVEGNW